jgi:hypothetical protein
MHNLSTETRTKQKTSRYAELNEDDLKTSFRNREPAEKQIDKDKVRTTTRQIQTTPGQGKPNREDATTTTSQERPDEDNIK